MKHGSGPSAQAWAKSESSPRKERARPSLVRARLSPVLVLPAAEMPCIRVRCVHSHRLPALQHTTERKGHRQL